MDEKLQKVLARAGLGSRREMERLIEAGEVTVNGRVATLGDRVTPQDEVRVGGRRIGGPGARRTPNRVILYNKPEGELCTRSDPEGRPTVFASLPRIAGARWISVGRLDVNSCGLLLFTTDGELAHRLMHPSSQVEREYAVRVLGAVGPEDLQALQEGVLLDDGLARFDSIRFSGGEGANAWYHVTLREGRNREVRRLWESRGLKVSRLIRVRFGDVTLPRGLKPGAWAELEIAERNRLRMLAGMAREVGDGKGGGKRAPQRGRAQRGRGRRPVRR